ncbi:MAG: Gfo/Idh/MocA family oxidoreductase [Planctomycetota bacterium]
MAGKKKTRVALVRCDTHGYWFGAFMDEVDPLILYQDHEDAPTRACIHHYFKDHTSVSRLKIERVPGFVITKIFDNIPENGRDKEGGPILQYGSYPGRAKEFSRTFKSHPKICETLDEMVRDVDAAYIADSSAPGDGADHLELVRPFLEKGIPCFVDKPIAKTLADAKEIIRLAQAHNTCVMSASILSHTKVGKLWRKRWDEIGDVKLLVAIGVGPADAAVIHGLGLVEGMVGYGVESVECIGTIQQECMLLHYPDQLEVVLLNSPDVFPRTCSFRCSAYSKTGDLHSPWIGDPEFYTGTQRIIELFRQMVDTGKPSIPYENVLEPIAIMEAARIAKEKGKRVQLREVLGDKPLA